MWESTGHGALGTCHWGHWGTGATGDQGETPGATSHERRNGETNGGMDGSWTPSP